MRYLLLLVAVMLAACSFGSPGEDERSRRQPPPQSSGGQSDGDGTPSTRDPGIVDVGCRSFQVVLTSGCSATHVIFWPASGEAISERVTTSAERSAGLTVPSPARACSATLEWPGRWDSWVGGFFPGPNAPQGYCLLEGGVRVSFGELKKGEGAYGCTHDGRTKYGILPCAGGGSDCYATR